MSALSLGKAQSCLAMGALFVYVGFSIPELGFFALEEGNYLSSESQIFAVFHSSFIHVFGKTAEHCIAQQAVIYQGQRRGYPKVSRKDGNHRHGEGCPHAYTEQVIGTVSAQHKSINFLT